MLQQILKVRIRIQDPYYREKLKEYVQKYYIDRIWLQEDDGIQEIPAEDYLITDSLIYDRDRTLVLSFEDAGEGSVSALQPADRIIAAVMDMAEQESFCNSGRDRYYGGYYSEQVDSMSEDSISGTEKIAEHFMAVYSPQGGCGKTTFALTYADIQARCNPNKRVLYWMMEDFPEWEEYFESNSRFTMSDGIYWSLMGERDEFIKNMDLMAVQQKNGAYFIRPCRSSRDLEELTDEQILAFEGLLADSFDLIICDMASAWGSINRRLLPLCGRVFLLYRDTAAGKRRLESFLQTEKAKIPGRITLVQIGESEPVLIRDAAVLPRSPIIWKKVDGRRAPALNTDYYDRVWNLF